MAKLNVWGNTDKVYLAVAGWKLVQRLDDSANVPWMIERELTFWPNMGQIVKELHFSNVIWMITNMEIRTNDFNWNTITSLNISLDDNVIVQFNEKQMSAVTNSLLNVDFSKEIKISAYLKKDKNAFSFEQDWVWVPWAVTKATPMDCPQPVQKLVKWVEKWDFSEYEEWFYTKAQEIIVREFPNGKKVLNQTSIDSITASDVSEIFDTEDDWNIPF